MEALAANQISNTEELILALNQKLTTFTPPKGLEGCAWVGSLAKAKVLNISVAGLDKPGEAESIRKGYPGGTLGNFLSSEIFPIGTTTGIKRYISSLCIANTLKVLAKPNANDQAKYLVSNDTTAGFEIEGGITLRSNQKKILSLVSPVSYSPSNNLRVFAFDTSIDIKTRQKAAKLLLKKVSPEQQIDVCVSNSTMFVPTSFLGDSVDLHDAILEPYSTTLNGFTMLLVTTSGTCDTKRFLDNLADSDSVLPLGHDFGQLVSDSIVQPKSIGITAANFAARTLENPGNRGFKFSSYTANINDSKGFEDFFSEVGHGPMASLIKSFA